MKTFLEKNIPPTTRGIVYLCDYNSKDETIKVIREVMFDNTFDALNFYANTRNPESHIATGETYDELLVEINQLNKLLRTPTYLKELKEYL